MTKEELKAQRKKIIMELNAMINKDSKPEDFIFYHHPNEDHIVLSHALFWVMTKPMANKYPQLQIAQINHPYNKKLEDHAYYPRF